MAVLTVPQMRRMSRHYEANSGEPIDFTKAQVRLTFQAIEDKVSAGPFLASMKTDMETAAGITITAAQRNQLFRAYKAITSGN